MLKKRGGEGGMAKYTGTKATRRRGHTHTKGNHKPGSYTQYVNA